MSDLSAYINFSLLLDYSKDTPELLLTDISNYPGGVAESITGKVEILQPDGLTTDGNFGDVVYLDSQLTVAVKELRRSFTQRPQNGTYRVTYTVRAAGYEDTVIIRTFQLSYTPASLIIVKALDVFTPELSLIDTTSYSQSGLLLQSVERSWNVEVGSVGVTGGVSQTQNISLGGLYYDAAYVASLTTMIDFDLNGFTWVSLRDALYKTITFTANTPATIDELRQSLVTLKEEDEDDYIKANAIFTQFVDRGRVGDLDGLVDYVAQLLKIFNHNITPTYENTNEPIPPYDWGITTIGTVDWGNILNKPPDVEVMFRVGDSGFPAAGSNEYTNTLFAGRKLLVSRGGFLQWSANPGDGNSYYEKLKASPTMTFYGYLTDGESIHIIAL
jgi:hypothetical protein